jgi:hypothetical protein
MLALRKHAKGREQRVKTENNNWEIMECWNAGIM